jgi:uncharacterized iron-regulated protein
MEKIMMKKAIFLIFTTITVISLSAQDKKAYQLYNSDGEPVSYSEMLADLLPADLIFFGEQHNSPIAHWLQLDLTKDLYENKKDKLVISAEMFESDNQVIVDEYMNGFITKARFEAECRLWPNYDTDYKPLLEFARDSGLVFVAANVPRRYANMVSKKGFDVLDSISREAKSFLPPLPIEYDPTVGSYKSMMEMEGMPAHITENLPKAQALKDATMAHFINKYFKTGGQLIHYNGSFHSNNHEGVVWYMNRYSTVWKIKVIANVEQKDISSLEEENLGLGDYILVVPENMTKTY